MFVLFEFYLVLLVLLMVKFNIKVFYNIEFYLYKLELYVVEGDIILMFFLSIGVIMFLY